MMFWLPTGQAGARCPRNALPWEALVGWVKRGNECVQGVVPDDLADAAEDHDDAHRQIG